MQLVCPSNPLTCLPLNVIDGPSETGARLGGRPPVDVRPAFQDAFTQYFLTLPFSIEPVRELSIFICSDFSQLLETCGTLHKEGLVQVVIHEESRRGEASSLSSNLSEHPL